MESDSFKLGVQAARAGDYQTAQTHFIQAVQSNPNSEKAWLYLGHCITDAEKRITCYQRVLKLNPSNQEAQAALSALSQPNPSQEINPYAEIRQPAPQPPAAKMEQAPPVSAAKSKKRSRLVPIVLTGCAVSLFLCLGIFIVVALTRTDTKSQSPTTQPASDMAALELPAPAASTGAGKVCLGFWNNAVACLDERGWQTYSADTPELSDASLRAAAICPDGRLAIANTKGISLVNDQQWERIVDLDEAYGMAQGLACDRDGHLWAAHSKGVSRYADGVWQTYAVNELVTGELPNEKVFKVIAAPDGKIWVLTVYSVAMFADEKWTIFQDGQGFLGTPLSLTLDAAGRPWAGFGNEVAVYNNGTWQQNKINVLDAPQMISLDARGRLWLATFNKGLASYDGQTWSSYNMETHSLSSDTVTALAADSLGRVWAGTSYGLSVFDGSQWQTYRMDNSDLLDNKVAFVVVERDGPTLAPPVDKEKGSLTGKLPLRYKRVELCIDYVAGKFSGETPCSGQLFFLSTRTDEQGFFSFENVPAGYYSIVAETNNGWAKYFEESGSEWVLIRPGEQYDLGELELTQNR